MYRGGGGKSYKQQLLCICKEDNAIAICCKKTIHYPSSYFESAKLRKKIDTIYHQKDFFAKKLHFEIILLLLPYKKEAVPKFTFWHSLFFYFNSDSSETSRTSLS